jgi:hypothetical protein
VSACPQCGNATAASFRFCPWCAAPLRRKLVEFFRPHAIDVGRSLRVSRYLEEGHVRFSIWNADGVAGAAVSVDEGEAERLAAFVQRSRPRRRRLIDQLLAR